MSGKCQEIFDEMLALVPTTVFSEFKKNRAGKMKFPVYLNESLKTTDLEVLELSMRANNCLHRAGYNTIGDVVESIETMDDLRRIRNCGEKSVKEIMEKIFCYHYCLLDTSQKIRYIHKIIECNTKY